MNRVERLRRQVLGERAGDPSAERALRGTAAFQMAAFADSVETFNRAAMASVEIATRRIRRMFGI